MVESTKDQNMIEEAFSYQAGGTQVYQEEKPAEDIEEDEEVNYQYP